MVFFFYGVGHFGKKGRIYAVGVLHFSIFCVFIGEGWDTLAKKAVYTPWEGKLWQGAKF